jgi:protein tyrosine phosphatase (PTP) superfamily phosphohydrolase (DUF442 family)
MAVITATLPRPVLNKRRVSRRALRILIALVVGYVVLWATGALGILAVSYWAREQTPAPQGTRTVQGIHHFQPVDREGRLWRGAAPSLGGYRALAGMGFTTVVDLRAEDLSGARLAEPAEAGLKVVRLPIRDGQTPMPEQVRRLLDVVARSSGPVFVHCGAGVGRTGTMAAAYLVQTGDLLRAEPQPQQGGSAAAAGRGGQPAGGRTTAHVVVDVSS